MKKIKESFLFLLFFISLISISSPYIVQANNLESSCYLNEVFEGYSKELTLSNFLKDLSIKGFNTERLEINQIKKEDYDTLANYLMDHDVTRYLIVGGTLKFNNLEEAKRYVDYLDRIHTATFILRLKDSKKPIGMLGFSFVNMAKDRVINISYWLGKEYQSKGYAKEAIPMVINEAFNNIENFKFYIDFRTQNIASKKLANNIISYIEKNNAESSKLIVEKFNCFCLDIEEYLIFKRPEDVKNSKEIAA